MKITTFLGWWILAMLFLVGIVLFFTPMIEWRSYVDYFLTTPAWIILGDAGFFLLISAVLAAIGIIGYEVVVW